MSLTDHLKLEKVPASYPLRPDRFLLKMLFGIVFFAGMVVVLLWLLVDFFTFCLLLCPYTSIPTALVYPFAVRAVWRFLRQAKEKGDNVKDSQKKRQ
jgi:hypothetical protein